MKNILFVFFIAATLISCKNTEEKSEDMPATASEETTGETTQDSTEYSGPNVQVGMPIYRGEFIFTGDAAVIKGKDFIYGVAIDTLAKELAAKVAPIKQDEFDMVPVVVQGILSKKPEGSDGWDEVLAIKNIISISRTPAKADIKIEEKN